VTPYYQDDAVKIYCGDCRAVLREMPAGSINCCVTSPPYFGLRDYCTAKWEGGGDPSCDHIDPAGPANAPSDKSTLTTNCGKGPLPGDKYQTERKAQFRQTCRKCGASRIDAQIGLEQTPDEYVAQLVAVFREVRRVLRDDGTLWLNLGDSYAANRGYQVPDNKHTDVGNNKGSTVPCGLKPKDLMGIPWRVAFALQADGWYLRQDLIWHKPNPMPESVTDRCTKAHEYIFLLAKSERYYYDAEAVKESSNGEWNSKKGFGCDEKKSQGDPMLRTQGHGSFHADEYKTGRNRRSVWTVATQPYDGAHFATFPPALITPCILAGCPAGGVVLDPFMGSGTTAYVAKEHNRKAVGVELNAAYIDLAANRMRQEVLPFSA